MLHGSSLKTIQLSPVLPPQSNPVLFAPQWQVILPPAVSLLEQKVVPGARRKRQPAQSAGLSISRSVHRLMVKLTTEIMLQTSRGHGRG